jgi:motility quorum-sensing regulator / GCU-specific mRNA interferase toxin
MDTFSRGLIFSIKPPLWGIKSPLPRKPKECKDDYTMEKRKSHYSLDGIKAAFADPAKLNRTFVSKQGADDLGMDDSDVVAVIQNLRLADFDKSMTSNHDHTLWQDVYKPTVAKRTVYVKFTLDQQRELLLISFKEA